MSDGFNYEKIDWKVPVERSLLIDRNIDNSSMRLYLILLSYAREKTTAFPSRETLAEDMGCSVRNIDLLKKKLQKYKLLTWNTKYFGNKKHNTYFLLKYKPIKASDKKNSSSPKRREFPVNNKQVKNKHTNTRSSFSNDKFDKVVENWKASYEEICNDIDPEIKENIQSGWINNSNYQLTNGDRRNLEQFYKDYGDTGLKKLEISFKFLKDYIEDKVEYGQFYNSNGAELVPTISLFTKSKIQQDGIMEWATHQLRIANKEFE